MKMYRTLKINKNKKLIFIEKFNNGFENKIITIINGNKVIETIYHNGKLTRTSFGKNA